uniref:F-box/LRR-repeat protein 15-like leucin rich repeat domain-containing protein n=1 Tax=Spongospora subterranea TaxID=70186 RepID=A0A0H5R8T2_9EUKA|eukprot:CRZ10533.1 hypothetical protein [Spongospora subterranea]
MTPSGASLGIIPILTSTAFLFTGSSSDCFTIEDKLRLHGIYCRSDRAQLQSMLLEQVDYVWASQGSSRSDIVDLIVRLFGRHSTGLQQRLYSAVNARIQQDFRTMSATLIEDRSASIRHLCNLTANTISCVKVTVSDWLNETQGDKVHDHIRRVLHGSVSKLNNAQRQQAVSCVFPSTDSTPKSNELMLIWAHIFSYIDYRFIMSTLRCINHDLFTVCHQYPVWEPVTDFCIHWPWLPSSQDDIAPLFRRLSSLRVLQNSRDPRELTSSFISAISKSCPHLERVNLDGWTSLTDEHVTLLSRSCPTIQYISLNSCRLLTNRTLLSLHETCPQIEHLSMTNCPKVILSEQVNFRSFSNVTFLGLSVSSEANSDLFDGAFANLLSSCPRLIELRFAGRSRIDIRGLAGMPFCAVRVLDLSNCSSIDDSCAEAIGRVCPCLQSLDLSHCPIVDMRAAKASFNRLEIIRLSCCSQLSNKALRNLSSCERLSGAFFDRCQLINDAGLNHLVRNCLNMRSLSVNDCCMLTKQAIISICKGMAKLESLSLQGLLSVDNNCLKAVSLSLPCLAEIDISSCSRITDDGISSLTLLKYPSRLRRLNMANLSNLTDISMQSLLSFDGLERLNIGGSSAVSYEGFLILCASACRQSLIELSVSNCPAIEDETVKLMAMCFSQLHSLDLSLCPKLTDYALKSIASESRSIRELCLSDCNGITPAGITFIAEHAPFIKDIDVTGCPRTSLESITGLRARFPHLQIAYHCNAAAAVKNRNLVRYRQIANRSQTN